MRWVPGGFGALEASRLVLPSQPERSRGRSSSSSHRGPPRLGPASSLLLLAQSLGLGACWPSRSGAHCGEKGPPSHKPGAAPGASTESWQHAC